MQCVESPKAAGVVQNMQLSEGEQRQVYRCTHCKELDGGVQKLHLHLLGMQTLLYSLGLQDDNALDVLPLERLEHRELIYPVDELWPEV